MNIAQFTESYKPYISGVTVSVETLSKELTALGHKTFVFAPMYPGHRERGPTVYRFRSVGVSRYPGFRLAVPYSRNILRLIPKLGLDIIHSHTPFQLGLLSMRLAKQLEIPYIYTLHTLFAEYLHYLPLLSPRLTRPLAGKMITAFCDRCDAVVVPTQKVKDLLIKDGVSARIEVIPTGIDFGLVDKADPSAIRSRHKIPEGAPLLLFVGRLSKEKNLPFLLHAFRRVLDGEKEARLLIVAGGPKEKEIKALAASLRLGDRAVFTGEIKRDEVFDYYAPADVFVFPSLTETQGLVIAEAKAAGVPVVAIAAQGVSEMVKTGEDGFLVGPSVEEFSQKVLALIKGPALRKNMGLRARENVYQELSSGAIAKKMVALYEAIAI